MNLQPEKSAHHCAPEQVAAYARSVVARTCDLRKLMQEATGRLARIDSDNPRLEAEYLAAHALGLERRQLLLLDGDDPLPDGALSCYLRLLRRRESREPLQYILGTVPFCDLDLEVGPGVLIPRPETEVLVERVLHWIRVQNIAPQLEPGSVLAQENSGEEAWPWVVDVGTGTGAILFALLAQLPRWRGLGLDCSKEALSYAARNRLRNAHLLGTRAALACGDLLTAVPIGLGSRAQIQLIVSNPPYIPASELATLAAEVAEHEPRLALDGGADGLRVVRQIVEQSSRVLAPGGIIACELGLGQSARVAALFERARFHVLEQFVDLTGRDRGVIAWRPASAPPSQSR